MKGRDQLSEQLASLWWTFLLRGLAAAAVGVAALFWPKQGIELLVRLVGVLLVLDGGLTLLGFGRRGLIGGVGMGAALIGLVLLIWPEGTVRIAFFLIGVWVLIIGIGSLAATQQMHENDPQRGSMRVSGFVALLFGLMLMVWPTVVFVALGWVIAFGALAMSVVMFWLASRFRKAGDRVGMKNINR